MSHKKVSKQLMQQLTKQLMQQLIKQLDKSALSWEHHEKME
jgi:hypothetical protein